MVRAAVVRGERNSNECPFGSVRIASEGDCVNAAASVDDTDFIYRGAWSLCDYPKGCFYVDIPTSTILSVRDNTRMRTGVYYNAHDVGKASYVAKLLCLAGTAAPTRTDYTYPPTGTPGVA